MKKFFLNLFRFYFRNFPVRKGKIPVMLLTDKLKLTKNFQTITTFDKNIKINVNLDDWIQKQIFYFGRYEIEKNETLFWQNIIHNNDIIADIGANIGYYSLMASIRCGNHGKIYSFEPVSSTYNNLIKNIKINNFKNIIPERLAISNSEGEIELYVADEKSTGSSSVAMHVNFSGLKEKVKTIKFDDYVSKNKINRLNYIKIDVEGCEPWVIEGMENVMSVLKPIILIEVLDERLNTIRSSKEILYSLFNKREYSAFEIKTPSEITKIEKPKEGGLIIFKHKATDFPKGITIV